MPKVFQAQRPTNAATGMTAASTTYYAKPGTGGMPNVGYTTETNAQHIERFNGTWSRIGVKIIANSRLTAGTLRSRKNGSNGAQSVSILASTTGYFEDTSNSDSVAPGDTFGLAMTNGTGTAALSVEGFYGAYEATGAHRSHYTVENSSTATNPSNQTINTTFRTKGMGLIGINMEASSDTNEAIAARAGGSLTNFYVDIISNAKTNDCTAGLRISGSAGNNVVTVLAGVTGRFEDTTHSDSITNASSLAVYILTGADASHSLVPRAFGYVFTGGGNYSDIACASTGTVARGLNGTNYTAIVGPLAYRTTEADAQMRMPFDGRFSNLRVRSGTLNSVVTVKLRKNGSDGNMSVTTTSSGSGLFEDTTAHDDFVDTDLIDLSWTSASGSVSNHTYAAMMVTPPPAPPSTGQSGLLQIVS